MSSATAYLMCTLKHTLDRRTLEILEEKCAEHTSNNRSVTSPFLAQRQFNIDQVSNLDGSQQVRVVIIATPLRRHLLT
jgi:hypothetical protein